MAAVWAAPLPADAADGMDLDPNTGLAQELDGMSGLGACAAASTCAVRVADRPPEICLPEAFLAELLVSAILQNFQVLQALDELHGSAAGPCCRLRPKGGWDGWKAIAATLSGLAYELSAADPWLQLGLIPFACRELSEAAI